MTVFVEGRSRDTAVLLLAAAESLDLPASVVLTTSKGYLVPDEVAEAADAAPAADDGDSDGPPAQSASKAEWAEYAGLSEAESKGMTKAEIIEKYGTQE